MPHTQRHCRHGQSESQTLTLRASPTPDLPFNYACMELVMLTLFTLASFEAVMPLPLAFQTLGETLAAARRIFSLVDAPPAVQEPDTPQAIPASLHFSFESVDFRYPTDATLALQGIHLDFPPAHRIAVVDTTGSGKSTLASPAADHPPSARLRRHG